MEQGLLADCAQTHRPAEFAGFDTLTVLTLSLDGSLDPAAGSAAAVIADGETVYASTEHLFVATNVWVPPELMGDARLEVMEEDYSTALHAFDITGDGPARYLASGSVDGHLLNQFSMDEYDGHLRVATTDGSPWGANSTSKSGVSVWPSTARAWSRWAGRATWAGGRASTRCASSAPPATWSPSARPTRSTWWTWATRRSPGWRASWRSPATPPTCIPSTRGACSAWAARPPRRAW